MGFILGKQCLKMFKKMYVTFKSELNYNIVYQLDILYTAIMVHFVLAFRIHSFYRSITMFLYNEITHIV